MKPIALSLPLLAVSLAACAPEPRDGSGDAVPATEAATFQDVSLEDALASTKDTDDLVLVDFTAEWCPPCQKMEANTWPDPGVRTWLAENATAVQVDVDEEESLARRYEIRVIPTIVVFRGGKEIARATGYAAPEKFLDWGKSL